MDVAAYGSKLPTQVIDLCKFASCPLSQNSTTSTSKLYYTFPVNKFVALPVTSSGSANSRPVVYRPDPSDLLDSPSGLYPTFRMIRKFLSKHALKTGCNDKIDVY